jgi:ankyrin repeat protein
VGWGNEDIVRLLLESGADVNAQLIGGRYGSALAAAQQQWGNEDTVLLLLESGADVNAQLSGG